MTLFVRIALIGIGPVILIGAFWFVELDNIKLITLPMLGIFSIVIGGIFAILLARMQKLSRAKTGSMFVQGAFTNIGSFGTLFCLVFIGEGSLAFVAMYRLFEEFVYYLVGFPIAKMYGQEKKPSRSVQREGDVDRAKSEIAAGKNTDSDRSPMVQLNDEPSDEPSSDEQEKKTDRLKEILLRLVKDPFIMASFLAIVIGGVLNMSPWERPEFYGTLNEWLVPIMVVFLMISIGYNMRLKAIGGYVRECLSISAVKFVLVPITCVAIAYLLGLGQIGEDQIVLKVILILSAMPPAFISLIPPQLYKLDIDLANSSFLFNSAALVVVLPILYWIIGWL